MMRPLRAIGCGSICLFVVGACAPRDKESVRTEPAVYERPVAGPAPAREQRLPEPRMRSVPSERAVTPPRSAGSVSFTSNSADQPPTGPISLGELRRHLDQGTAVFVDARKPEEFARGHLRGAYNVPASAKETSVGPVWQNVDRDQLVIVYCGGVNCHASENVASYLAANGFRNVRVFEPGWAVLGNTRDLAREASR